MSNLAEFFNMEHLTEHANGGRRNNPRINSSGRRTHRPLQGTSGRNRLGGPTDNYRRTMRRERRFLRNLPFFYPRYVNQPVYVNPRVAQPTYVAPHYTWYYPWTWWYEGFENERNVNLSMLAVLLFLVMMIYLMNNKK